MNQVRPVSTLRPLEKKNKYKAAELTTPSDGSLRSTEPRLTHPQLAASTNESFSKTPIVGVGAATKRLCDFLISGTALIILLPLFALLSILIKLDSTGPALFYQQRRGRNRELIKVYKFRTMYQNHSTPVPTEKSFKQTQKNDPRVTRLGAFLRKTSLDELPQLFNVVQGTMSLVGPRPHPAPLDEKFMRFVPALAIRYSVKPGVTGWAQVNGFRGETTGVEDMMARVEHDRHYIKNWSLWLDLKIIAMTAIRGWTHRNAY